MDGREDMTFFTKMQYGLMHFFSSVGSIYYMIKYNMIKMVDLLDEKTVKRGRVAIVTGANRGMGYEVLKRLLDFDYTVITPVRDVQAMKDKLGDLNSKVIVMQADLSSIKSMEKFSEEVKNKVDQLHLLVNNGGIFKVKYALTEDGFESHLAVNYMSHFYLTHKLLDLLKKSAEKSRTPSRIVNVSSLAHVSSYIVFDNINLTGIYDEGLAYTRSKLAQLMSTRYLDRYFKQNGIPITCNAVNPGLVATGMFYNSEEATRNPWAGEYLLKPREGSLSISYCCLSQDLENKGGMYIDNCAEGYSSRYSKDKDKQKQLFDLTCSLLKIQEFGTD